jgi:hypothetical protein
MYLKGPPIVAEEYTRSFILKDCCDGLLELPRRPIDEDLSRVEYEICRFN